MTGQCLVDDCGRTAVTRGWCSLHYQRWRKHGTPTGTAYPQRLAVCVIDGCERPRRRVDYCGAHYARLLRHGDPLGGSASRAAARQPCTEQGCPRPARAHGRCRRHDRAHRLATDPEFVEQRRREFREWRARHAGDDAERQRRWRDANQRRRFRRLMAWKLDNPWHASAYSYAKRRRAYGLPDVVAEQVIPADIYERDGGVCQLCGGHVDRELPFPHPQSMTLDHRIPVSHPDSEHTYANVQLAHWECNRDRQAAPLAQESA